MSRIEELLSVIEAEDHLYIQTHDFPDHDAVASAFALQRLLDARSITARLIFQGEILHTNLSRMIEHMEIRLRPASLEKVGPGDKIIIVDGTEGNTNVSDLAGPTLAVIDHHQSLPPQDLPFTDIRPEVGACSSIIFSYYADIGVPISSPVATALMLGLLVDTALLADDSPLFAGGRFHPERVHRTVSDNHPDGGQNVLHADGRVGWATHGRVGVDGDDIFLVNGILVYVGRERPVSLNDSFLLPHSGN